MAKLHHRPVIFSAKQYRHQFIVLRQQDRVGIDVPLNRALYARVVAWEVEQGLRSPRFGARDGTVN